MPNPVAPEGAVSLTKLELAGSIAALSAVIASAPGGGAPSPLVSAQHKLDKALVALGERES